MTDKRWTHECEHCGALYTRAQAYCRICKSKVRLIPCKHQWDEHDGQQYCVLCGKEVS
jgi:hypothetical protein